MPLPLRMNPVPVTIKQVDVVATPKDPDFGEPKGGQLKRYAVPISVRAQIVYNAKDKRENALTGDPGNTLGHLCFRLTDLTGAGIVMRKGDVITSIAGVAVNYKITEVRPSGHLRGRANLLLTYFESNEETNPSLRR